MLICKSLPQCLWEVRHLVKAACTPDKPLVDLPALEWFVQSKQIGDLGRFFCKQGKGAALHYVKAPQANMLIMATMTPVIPSPPSNPLEMRFIVSSEAFVILFTRAEIRYPTPTTIEM